MSEQEDKGTALPQVSSWQQLVEGGLPQLLVGPAGKAISRLVGAAVEIPAAWLEQIAQGIRDKTTSKTTVMTTLAVAASNKVAASPELHDRAVSALLAREYRRQENKEAVAEKAVEQLIEQAESDPVAPGAGPTDDWMNVFESYVENASSERLRDLFGRILAGEIRKQGSFSLSTLQFVSLLDSTTAEAVVSVLPWVMDQAFITRKPIEDNVAYETLLLLEDVGFLSLGAGMLSRTINAPNETAIIRMGDKAIVAEVPGRTKLSLSGFALTRVAKELAGVIVVDHQITEVAQALWSAENPKSIGIGDLVKVGSQFQVRNIVGVPKRPSNK